MRYTDVGSRLYMDTSVVLRKSGVVMLWVVLTVGVIIIWRLRTIRSRRGSGELGSVLLVHLEQRYKGVLRSGKYKWSTLLYE